MIFHYYIKLQIYNTFLINEHFAKSTTESALCDKRRLQVIRKYQEMLTILKKHYLPPPPKPPPLKPPPPPKEANPPPPPALKVPAPVPIACCAAFAL